MAAVVRRKCFVTAREDRVWIVHTLSDQFEIFDCVLD